MDDNAMSVAEVARRLGVSAYTVYREIEDGVMPHNRIRRRITITPQQLETYRTRIVRVLPPEALSQLRQVRRRTVYKHLD